MAKALVKKLHRWYGVHARSLPWRHTTDPYALWVSEVMLQQTQVATVLDYYPRFLARFPTAAHLARADLADVLKAWEGLGYYSRARHLHRAAALLHHHGVPQGAEDWRRLPGVGQSTANALASFVSGHPAPVLDGNVQRVLCRLFGLEISLPAAGQGLKDLWALAQQLITHGDPATHNQAMMELGATVCLPRAPLCGQCPVRGHCLAHRQHRQGELPLAKPKTARKKVTAAVGLLLVDNRLLLTRRPENGLLGGLWELPGGKVEKGEAPAEAVVREFWEETGLKVAVTGTLAPVRHEYTHFSLRLHAFWLQKTGGRLSREAKNRHATWVRTNQLGELAFPTATHKVFRLAGFGPEKRPIPPCHLIFQKKSP